MQTAAITAISIDDEPMALEVIRQLASKVPFLELKASFTNALEALNYIQQNPPDVLFLDIKMPDISGLELVKSMQSPPMVVFTTAYSEHAVQSFELDAIDYLLKPFSFARFLKSCNKALHLHKLQHPSKEAPEEQPYIFVKSGYDQIRILLDDLIYLQSAGNYVHFHLRSQKILARLTLQEAEQLLPEGRFVRIHRSYIVAAASINRIERTQVWLGNQVSLPVGPGYVTELGQITGR